MKNQKRAKLYAVSNAHLDTQWNWTIKDTIQDCVKNTMDYNFALFEKYPSYRINFEGAFRYQLMKEYYPEKYEKVKEYVKSGNWVPVGSTWDAMDVNVPSSEALMRQVLYGNNFYEKEFGVLSKDIFLPDCFGFRAALPSIAAHMGLIGFSTQKLVWGVGSPLVNDDKTTLPPQENSDLPRLDLGKWRGPDGKEIFVSLLSGNYTYNFDNNNNEEPLYLRQKLLDLVQHNLNVSGVAARNLYFGTGDYGGSCSEGSARLLQEAIEHSGQGEFDVLSATPTDIYEDLTPEEAATLPVYEGGLLIPHGYGAMTSHTAMKRLNRQNEQAADACERVAVFAELLANAPYPQKRITDAWKTFLWHQFHDDLTGTSIADAYLYSHNDEILSQNIFRKECAASVQRLASLLSCQDLMRPFVLYNPCAFSRTEEVRIPLTENDEKIISVCDANGSVLPCAIYQNGTQKYLCFAPTLAPLSLTVFGLCETSCTDQNTSLSLTENTLENDLLKVCIDSEGNICSIFDKSLGKELLIAPIREEIYADNSTTWPSWEYEFEDLQKTPAYVSVVDSIELLDQRPISVGLRITKRYSNSHFVTEVTLTRNSPTVTLRTKTDWHEKNSLLLQSFPFTAQNENALLDGGLGAVKAGNTNTYPYFIHNMHKWADLTDKSENYGITLANDCKYALSKPNDNTLSVVLIHTPKGNFSPHSGQDFQDHGENIYAFSITAHSGDKPCIQAAEALNQPILALEIPAYQGGLTSVSLLSLNEKGIEVRAIKKEEKGNGIILRLQECYGEHHENVSVSLPFCQIGKAYAADGYERIIQEVPHKKSELTLDFTPYEVKTIYLELTAQKNETVASNLPLALPYNENVFYREGACQEDTVYLPAEQLPDSLVSAGIPYQTGDPLEKNALACHGQTLPLSGKHSHLRLLCASIKGEKEASFKIADDSITLSVLPMHEPVGARPMVVNGSGKRNTVQEIAHVFTHTKNNNGENRLYDFAYWFAYDLKTDGKTALVLPDDTDILIFAATETDLPAAKELTPLFDDNAPVKRKQLRRLNAVGCKNGSGYYEEGATVLLYAPPISDDGLFEGFEAENIIFKENSCILVEIPDHDLTVQAKYRSLGKNIALNKPCTANRFMNRHESAEKAVNGKPFSKWCGAQDENGLCLLEVDLEKEESISSVLIGHAGGVESELWNTADFEVQVKCKEDEPYRTVISVTDNHENVTLHPLENVKARYVRLYITKPAHDGDRHARIYHFHLYSENN